MDELRAIEMLREVLLGERREALPQNSVQTQRAQQQQSTPKTPPTDIPCSFPTNNPSGTPINYDSDGEDDDKDNRPASSRKSGRTIRRSKRALQQLRDNKKEKPHLIVALAAHEKLSMPDLTIKDDKFRRGWASANLDLQMKEWAFQENFAGAIIDDKTGEKLEYRDLIKRPELQQRCGRMLLLFFCLLGFLILL